MFKQYGIDLSCKTMAQWMIQSQLALQRLYERPRVILLRQSVIQADETTLKVICETKNTCYMWLYCCGTNSPSDGPIPNIVLYDYQNSRRGQYYRDFTYVWDMDGYSMGLKEPLLCLSIISEEYYIREIREVYAAKTGLVNITEYCI